TLDLKAGQYYALRMEYYTTSTPAVAELRWSSPSTTKTIIPQGQFFFLPSGPLQAFYAGFTILYKGAMLVNTFGLTVQEVTYLSTQSTNTLGFDFQGLLFHLFGSAPFEQ